jgi:MYXO-CTERM domain-containing protein
MDVSGNGAFWFRDTNHATETACTYNKVASSTKGSGPAKTITLNTGESACWYVDSTAGATIPTGIWETLLDLSNSGGADYNVSLEIWNLDTNTVAETIQSCNDQTSFGNDIRCFLDPVAQKVLTGTQVVRLVFVHSAASGTVSIEYDDSDSTGDSRTTLPIPEFSDVAPAALAVVVLLLAVRARRRRPASAL